MAHKNPSPTPPHKGEGLTGGTDLLSKQALQPARTIGFSPAGLRVSPSPLWGGVGEGNP